jgi:HD-GYP domain-containing protein (c-di-GMP phosphodiesterase class II)
MKFAAEGGIENGVATRAGEYVPVALASLIPHAALPFELYLKQGIRGTYLLFCSRFTPLTANALTKLGDAGIEALYVPYDDCENYRRHLSQALLENDNLSLSQRYHLSVAISKSLFDAALRNNDLNVVVDVATQVAEHIVERVFSQTVVMQRLFELMFHDYSTYTHANNVAIYCVAMAKALGIASKNELSQIAAGALLHDLGKRHIPQLVLNQSQGLTAKQKSLIRRHPQLGFEELCHRPEVSWGELMMVYQHHERLNGTGYPARIDGREIHPWAQLCAVADVFDALTSERPGRHAWRPDEALRYLSDAQATHYDSEIVQCMIALAT